MKQIEKNIYQRGECSFQVKMMFAGSSINETFDSLIGARAYRDQKSVCRAIDPDAKKIFASRLKRSLIKSTTLKSVLIRYEKEILPGKAATTQSIEKVYLERIRRDSIASMSIYYLEREDIVEFISQLSKCMDNKNKGKPLSDKSKRHYAGLLSHVFNTAIEKWRIDISNPMLHIDWPSLTRGRCRRLENDEEERLFQEIRKSRNRLLLPFVVMAIETGSRRGELLKLEWDDVKLLPDCGSALLRNTKNGDDRVIPLSGSCVEILSKLPRPIKGGRVFPVESFRTAWEEACQRAGIVDLHIHDLRHESISRLFELGLNVLEVASISGHKTLSILRDYTHLRPQKLARKINLAKAVS